jgi:hypothetical protein
MARPLYWEDSERAQDAVFALVDFSPKFDERVYFIQSGLTGPIKIGWTGWCRGPESRLRNLQGANAYRLRLLAATPADVKAERRLHRIFEADRLEGEWFRLSRDLIMVCRAIREWPDTMEAMQEIWSEIEEEFDEDAA